MCGRGKYWGEKERGEERGGKEKEEKRNGAMLPNYKTVIIDGRMTVREYATLVPYLTLLSILKGLCS